MQYAIMHIKIDARDTKLINLFILVQILTQNTSRRLSFLTLHRILKNSAHEGI